MSTRKKKKPRTIPCPTCRGHADGFICLTCNGLGVLFHRSTLVVKGGKKGLSEMRKRSGFVTSSNPLVGFLYILMRDHITPGSVEGIMVEHELPGKDMYTNGWLANYAKDVAHRLVKGGKK